ncbi:NTF2-related export protein 2 isoform X1 [Fukomys damarensis]|uniref:NTF2-related export protein 2 n=3 Tax=Fukomys damarensis TaxID=885580 RepID=A0A091D0M9_FUKDA|nr:NTF2-related export protein 2 isoform X1 [Fukomys damarensis]KFO24063.1 NTF2-related export protein 2 [Fukomys damarensis]
MSKFQRDRFQEDREQYYRRNEYYRENPRASSAHRRDQTREDEVTPPVPEKTTSSSLMTMSVDFKTYVDQACKAAEEFINIYYETMDKRRRALIRLYLNEATLVWNGNVVTGLDALNKFFEMLPSSEFQINMLDCQPVHEQATQSQATVLVVTSGIVKFDGNKQHYFNQNFLLTAQATPNSTVWKIASDCFRFQDWANS